MLTCSQINQASQVEHHTETHLMISIAVVIVADEEYPQKVILKIQRELFEEFYKLYKDTDVKAVTSKTFKLIFR